MDRIILRATLERAERFVSEGDHLIAKQKELITELLAHSLDVSRYEETLADFERSQRLHIEHVRTLKQELIASTPRPPVREPTATRLNVIYSGWRRSEGLDS